MSDIRETNMAKISASVEEDALLEQEAEQDEELNSLSPKERIEAERLKQAELKTQMAINRLEEAKQKATSDAVKAKLQEEIVATRQRKAEIEEARKTQLKEAAKTTTTVKTASDLVGTGAKIASDVRGSVNDTTSKVRETVGNVAGTLETVSTPGTIFLPVTILLIFFFLLLPVNGYTRAQWLWMSLTGSAKINALANGEEGVGQSTGQGGGGEPTTPTRIYTFTGVS